MFEHLTMKWLVGILVVGVVVFLITLLFNEDGRSVFQADPKQDYVTAQVDSTIAVRQLNPVLKIQVDTSFKANLTASAAVEDSDSLKRYDLYREQQEIVTIDLDPHKEHVFFTWDDIKAYFDGVILIIEKFKGKQE